MKPYDMTAKEVKEAAKGDDMYMVQAYSETNDWNPVQSCASMLIIVLALAIVAALIILPAWLAWEEIHPTFYATLTRVAP